MSSDEDEYSDGEASSSSSLLQNAKRQRRHHDQANLQAVDRMKPAKGRSSTGLFEASHNNKFSGSRFISAQGHHAHNLTINYIHQPTKKRIARRPCYRCSLRRKKLQNPEDRCTNCTFPSSNCRCAAAEAAKKHGPPKGYVENLENRVENLEKLLRRSCPDETVFKDLLASLDGNRTIERPPVDYTANQTQPDASGIGKVASAIRGAIEGISDTSSSSKNPHDHDDPASSLADKLERMVLSSSHNHRFLGKSSWGGLLHTAIELQKEHSGDGGIFGDPEKPVLEKQVAEPRGMKPWERESYATSSPEYNFPVIDLALHCIDLYFKCNNLYLPLLHRPTFDKNVEEGLHFVDERFASVFLLVCANGARYSDNPRVMLDGMPYSSGWKWFEQVQIMMRPPLAPPSLYDLQVYCLCAQYLTGTSSPQSSWTMVGIGIILAQEAGAHRQKKLKCIHTAEDELWKRAFWVLVYMDRMSSSALCRSCAIQDDDFDLDLPVDCDDEYWDSPDPEKCFKQPPNKPSSITAFILSLKLYRILAFSLRTIYSINKPKILLGLLGQPWEQHIVAELDSALNKWVDSIPDHLRWDPHKSDHNFFYQSASLYALYYDIQINIHRPFIPSPSKPSPLAFPSLAICTNAARSCSHILDILRERNVNLSPHLQAPAFTAGIVLLFNIWGGKRSGLSTDPNKEMVYVHNCMRVLETLKNRWYPVAGLSDVLYNLAQMRNLPLPQPSRPPTMKRDRESNTQLSTSANESPSDPISNKITRPIAGSRRVHREFSYIGETQQSRNLLPRLQLPQAALPPSATRGPPPQQAFSRHSQIRQNPESEQSTFNDDPPFALPVYTNELRRFPLHGQSVFTHQSQPQSDSPQLHPQANDGYTTPGSTQGGGVSEPTPHAISSGLSSSYWPRHPPAPAPQQQQHLPHLNQTSQSFQTGRFSSTLEMSSMTQAPYEAETAQMAPSMMLDSVAGGLAYTQQQTSTYGWGRTDSLKLGIGSPSTVFPLPQSSSGSSLENVYGGMRTDALPELPGGHSFQQHQAVPQPQEQLYPFSVDNDTAEIWSNAPTGFGPAEWCTYLTTLGA